MDFENLEVAAWDYLEEIGVSEQALQLITDINGYNMRTLYNVLYAYSGENLFPWEEDPEKNF